MNTSKFLEVYKEIERLIQENLAEIRQAYDLSEKYEYNRFFINSIDEVHIELVSECYHEYDHEYVDIPLEYFESDEILKSHLTEI